MMQRRQNKAPRFGETFESGPAMFTLEIEVEMVADNCSAPLRICVEQTAGKILAYRLRFFDLSAVIAAVEIGAAGRRVGWMEGGASSFLSGTPICLP